MNGTPCLYLFIYRRIRERSNGRNVVAYSLVDQVMAETAHNVPKKFRYVVLEEMEKYSLIKKIDKHKVRIVGGKADNKLEKYSLTIFE